jgi:CBS domain-containing protein
MVGALLRAGLRVVKRAATRRERAARAASLVLDRTQIDRSSQQTHMSSCANGGRPTKPGAFRRQRSQPIMLPATSHPRAARLLHANATPERLNAGEVCTRVVVVVPRGMPVVEAAQLMRTRHVGALVVVDEVAAGRAVVGMLTDRDIVVGVVAAAVDPGFLRVEDLMSTDLVTAPEEASIIELLGTMLRRGVRRVPIVDADGILVGLVTIDDLIGVVADESQLVVRTIEAGRRREPAARP